MNDLQSKFPEIAAEADGWDPSTLMPGSNKKVKWKCSLGHQYISSVNSRTNKTRKSGCPFCAGKKVWVGFNDLKTFFPELAEQADGWDPSSITSKSGKKVSWICEKGHQWKAVISSRTKTNGNGCPYCSNRQAILLKGTNDLKTKFPEIAAEADGWDPSTVVAGSHKKKNWKCSKGHTWEMSIDGRTNQNRNCPYCANQRAWSGFNDLKTKFPEIAAEAHGWDPSKVVAGSNSIKSWICDKGHKWDTSLSNRVLLGNKCPFCCNQRVWIGFNDLKTKFPEIAVEADGWDPSKVVAGSKKKLPWKCNEGHQWKATAGGRTVRGDGCPYCSNKKLWSGFNDLKTKFPEIAVEADGWDPSKVIAGSQQRRDWKCNEGHKWNAIVANRTRLGNCCPVCAEYGFNPGKPAWFYLMEREGEQQLGITNHLEKRMSTHSKNGWVKVDLMGPISGEKIFDTEKKLKKWLRSEIGVIEGTQENWYTTNLKVSSLSELRERSGLRISIF